MVKLDPAAAALYAAICDEQRNSEHQEVQQGLMQPTSDHERE
jgi:hypothetical protein